MTTLRELPVVDEARPLATYAYSYPHKSSYAALDPPVPIAEAWRHEDVGRLSLYAHVPFCEMRCGFCNLFTLSQPKADVVAAYLDVLLRQIAVVKQSVPDATFQQLAVGGGTPTHLPARELERLLTAIDATFGAARRSVPSSVETSPATATIDRLNVLADFGVQRVSLGIQSFVDEETRVLGRPQQIGAARRAIEAIRDRGFPVLNLDLIYGDARQSRETWLASLKAALAADPEELYLYPLYVRPETGLARRGGNVAEHRRDLYRAARDTLFERGYVQASLRCFRKPGTASPSTYACQRDGMIGLGCGARSYTRRLHYATRFAVSQPGVRAILGDWLRQSDADLALATHGIELSSDEQRRRFAIMSLLQAEGMAHAEYESLFHSLPREDLPEIDGLIARGWLDDDGTRLVPTAAGMERSDELGPLLYSEPVRTRLEEFTAL